MQYIENSARNGVATITLTRGKVSALNEELIEQLRASLEEEEKDSGIVAIILTGTGKFFSFGFDIPEFMNHSKEDFRRFVIKFTSLYRYMFTYSKPLIAALNGHTIAGGCMIATACDYRIMASGKAKISLNEITFGSSVFAGAVDILKYCVGQRNAETILLSGDMYAAEDALALGLIDQVSDDTDLLQAAENTAQNFAIKNPPAFKSIKKLLRQKIANEMIKDETNSIEEFLDIWYSMAVRKNLEKIQIRG